MHISMTLAVLTALLLTRLRYISMNLIASIPLKLELYFMRFLVIHLFASENLVTALVTIICSVYSIIFVTFLT